MEKLTVKQIRDELLKYGSVPRVRARKAELLEELSTVRLALARKDVHDSTGSSRVDDVFDEELDSEELVGDSVADGDDDESGTDSEGFGRGSESYDDEVASYSHDSMSFFLLAFASIFTLVLISPPLLTKYSFPFYTALSCGDVFDFVAGAVLVATYVETFRRIAGTLPGGPRRWVSELASVRAIVYFIALAGWAESHGYHVSANSINNYVNRLDRAARSDSPPRPGMDRGLMTLVHFYDEFYSHLLSTVAMMLMHFVLAHMSLEASEERLNQSPPSPPSPPLSTRARVSLTLAILLFGFMNFAGVVEAGTTYLGLPYSAFLAAYVAVMSQTIRERPLARSPTRLFFMLSSLFCFLLFCTWSALNRDFIFVHGRVPEFSELKLF